jgi:hypothetical protein
MQCAAAFVLLLSVAVPSVALAETSGARRGAASAARQCLDDKPALAASGPWSLALDAGVALGLFFATHGLVSVSIGRQLWNRLELELVGRLAVGEHVIGGAGGVRAGLLLHLSRRIDLLLFWRLGYAHFRAQLAVSSVGVGSLFVSVGGEMKLRLTPALELRLAPIAGTGYWRELWGFVLEPTVGLAYRF